MNILLLSFYLVMNIAKKNELPQDPFTMESNNRQLLNGFDTRSNQYIEPCIERLIDLHEKHKIYLKLCSDKTPFLEKEKIAQEYLDEQTTMASNLFAGNLIEDWDFEI